MARQDHGSKTPNPDSNPTEPARSRLAVPISNWTGFQVWL